MLLIKIASQLEATADLISGTKDNDIAVYSCGNYFVVSIVLLQFSRYKICAICGRLAVIFATGNLCAPCSKEL